MNYISFNKPFSFFFGCNFSVVEMAVLVSAHLSKRCMSALIMVDTAVMKMNWLFMSTLSSVKISVYSSRIEQVYMMGFSIAGSSI